MNVALWTYVYPGWHACVERDRFFDPGFREWDLVLKAKPRFAGHRQPNIPLLGIYDDSDPRIVQSQITLAQKHGVQGFVYGFFWSRGKRVFEESLQQGFLTASHSADFGFALMWANRMPRRILPIKTTSALIHEPGQFVYTDEDDFQALIEYAAKHYFHLPNYGRRLGKPYFSIYDTTFFLRQLQPSAAKRAINRAKQWLSHEGLGGLYLVAIDPAPWACPLLVDLGFDAVTSYVWLPEWKGPTVQDYCQCAKRVQEQWPSLCSQTHLPFFPSACSGWDATPRAADFGAEKPARYPWSPIITGSQPEYFAQHLAAAATFATALENNPWVIVASWNEWSEGHFVEPDQRFEYGWLEAIQQVAHQ